jgi:hypothetical protein
MLCSFRGRRIALPLNFHSLFPVCLLSIFFHSRQSRLFQFTLYIVIGWRCFFIITRNPHTILTIFLELPSENRFIYKKKKWRTQSRYVIKQLMFDIQRHSQKVIPINNKKMSIFLLLRCIQREKEMIYFVWILCLFFSSFFVCMQKFAAYHKRAVAGLAKYLLICNILSVGRHVAAVVNNACLFSTVLDEGDRLDVV